MVPMLTCGLVRSNLALAIWPVSFSAVGLVQVGWGSDAGVSNRELLAPDLRDDLLRDVPRNLRVGVELHAVAGAALGARPEVAHVAEHLRQRHQRLDDAHAGALVHGLDHAAAAVEVTDDVAHVLLR